MKPRQGIADSAQLGNFAVIAGQVDFAVGVALRRVVTILQQDLAGMLATAGAALVVGQPAVEFLLAQLQQLLQQAALARAQSMQHGGCGQSSMRDRRARGADQV